jgi:hypothetical protein
LTILQSQPNLSLYLNLSLTLEPDAWRLIPRAEAAIASLKVPHIVRQKVPAEVYSTACSIASANASVTESCTESQPEPQSLSFAVPRIACEVVRDIVQKIVRVIVRLKVQLKVQAIVGFNLSRAVSAKATPYTVSGPWGGRQICGQGQASLLHMVYVLLDMRAENGSLTSVREAATPRRSMPQRSPSVHGPQSFVIAAAKSFSFRRFRTSDF